MCANKSIITYAILMEKKNRKTFTNTKIIIVFSVSIEHSFSKFLLHRLVLRRLSNYFYIFVFTHQRFFPSLHLFIMWSIKWHVVVQYAKNNAIHDYLYLKKKSNQKNTGKINRIKCANEERAKCTN